MPRGRDCRYIAVVWTDPRASAQAMLEAVGFVYHPATLCWVHWADKREIPASVVAAHDTDWLAHWITGHVGRSD